MTSISRGGSWRPLLILLLSGAAAGRSLATQADPQGGMPAPTPTPKCPCAAPPATTLTTPPTASPTSSPSSPPAPAFLGWQAYEENDSLVVGDERYTQGLRFTLSANPERLPDFVKDLSNRMVSLLSPDHEVAFEPGAAVTLGQTIYTPRIITSRKVDPNDRAFSGFLHVGGQVQATDARRELRHTLEIDVGFLGRPSLARFAQAGLHVLKASRIPKGWDQTNPRHRVVAHLSYRGERLMKVEKNKWRADLTAGQAAEVGFVRNLYGLHGAVRVGRHISGFPASVIQPAFRAEESSPRTRPIFEFGGIAGVEGRAIFHTALVKPTEGSPGFSANQLVGDARVGGFFRFSSFRATVQKVWRSAEFTIKGVPTRKQAFFSIAAAYEPTLDCECFSCAVKVLRDIFTHAEFELGMGRNLTNPDLGRSKPAGITGHLAMRIKAYKAFTLGAEIGGTGIESDLVNAAREDAYSDLFLRQGALSIGWRPRGPNGRLGFRVGMPILGQTAKIQIIRHPIDPKTGERVEDSETYTPNQASRRGWLVGLQYFHPVERHMAFGVDVTYRTVGLQTGGHVPGLVKPNFVNAVFAIQIRP